MAQNNARRNGEAIAAKTSNVDGLCEDNQQLTHALRATHDICDRHNDVATASLIENWIDESEKRTWFLAEIRSGL